MELKQQRRDPNVLYKGDEVFIPDLRIKEVSCTTGQKHRFRRKGVPEVMRIILEEIQGQLRAGLACRIIFGTEEHEVRTDDDGLIKVPIPPDATQGRLIVLEEDEETQEAIPSYVVEDVGREFYEEEEDENEGEVAEGMEEQEEDQDDEEEAEFEIELARLDPVIENRGHSSDWIIWVMIVAMKRARSGSVLRRLFDCFKKTTTLRLRGVWMKRRGRNWKICITVDG